MGAVVVLGRRQVFCVVVAVGLVAGTVVGCSSSSPDPSGSTTSPTVSASPSPDPSATAVQAEVLAVYHRYWDATVAAQRGNPDPTLFTGNATGPLVEEEVAQAAQYQKLGIVREGEPGFSKVTVEVHGDSAEVRACVDYSNWVAAGVEDNLPDVAPAGLRLERIGDAWLVTEYVKPPADFTC